MVAKKCFSFIFIQPSSTDRIYVVIEGDNIYALLFAVADGWKQAIFNSFFPVVLSVPTDRKTFSIRFRLLELLLGKRSD